MTVKIIYNPFLPPKCILATTGRLIKHALIGGKIDLLYIVLSLFFLSLCIQLVRYNGT